MSAKKLLSEIVDALSSSGGNLTDALMKTKVLLHKLGRKDLAGWVNLEATGYTEDVDVPPYRIIHAEVRGSITAATFNASDYPLPTFHLKPEQRKRFQELEIHESVAAIAALVDGDQKGGLRRPIPIEATALFKDALQPGVYVQTCWSSIGYGQMTQILTTVRSKLLDFLLELDEKIEEEMSDDELKKVGQSPATGTLFKDIVFGANTTIVIGNGNVQSVSNQIAAGDFQALAAILEQNKIPKEHVDSLKKAIDADKTSMEVVEQKTFGPSVKNWLTNLKSKAIGVSAGIELGVVANLATDALRAYYGWLTP